MTRDAMRDTHAALESLYAVGHWLIGQARHRDATALFQTMLLLDPTDMRGWLALGTCHEEVGEHEQALALYELASPACGAGAARCTLARARLLRSLGEDARAEAAYELAIAQATALGDEDLSEVLSHEVAA